MSSFRVGCSGDEYKADLFEILILILPEAETIRTAFLKWVSLPTEMKGAIIRRLEYLTRSGTFASSSVKDVSLHKGYSMSLVLLRVFHEWNDIQDKYGAPGIQPGFTALPKALEMDIAFMMRCVQETLEFVIRGQTETRQFMSRMKDSKSQYTESKSRNPYLARLSLSETQMSMCGDHVKGQIELNVQPPPKTSFDTTVDSMSDPESSGHENEQEEGGSEGSSEGSRSGSESGSVSQAESAEEESGASFDALDDCDPELVQFYSENPKLLQLEDSEEFLMTCTNTQDLINFVQEQLKIKPPYSA